MIQTHIQAINGTTNLNVKIYLTLPKFSATNILVWELHIDDSTRSRYNIILGRDMLTALGLNMKISERVIAVGDRYLKISPAPIIHLSM